jgi:hypothetical protein
MRDLLDAAAMPFDDVDRSLDATLGQIERAASARPRS